MLWAPSPQRRDQYTAACSGRLPSAAMHHAAELAPMLYRTACGLTATPAGWRLKRMSLFLERHVLELHAA